MKEYYPSLAEILIELGQECILVGSASRIDDVSKCKDWDFVVSDAGWYILQQYSYYLYKEDEGWMVYLPYGNDAKCVDFFHKISDIQDKSKYNTRVLFEQICSYQLKIKCIMGVDVLSI